MAGAAAQSGLADENQGEMGLEEYLVQEICCIL